MSCVKCEEESVRTFVRVGNGNVEIIGCKKHLKELIDLLRKSDDK